MIEPHLQKFLIEKIEPQGGIIEQASDSQSRLREILVAKLAAGEHLPDLLHGHEFLFGSAIRGTKPKPFDDIDMMLVLDGSTLVALQNGHVTGQAVGTGKDHNIVLLPQYLSAEGLVSSQKILGRIREVLADTYSRSEIRKDGQAINVWMDSYGFGIDVVPAFKITGHVAGDHYFIPAGTGSEGWQSTNPHADIGAFNAEDRRLNGLLRSTAKLMRTWNELSNGNRLSGFHVDALVLRSLEGKVVSSLEIAVLTCLVSFEDLLKTHCPQFSGFTPHIDQKLSDEDRRLSIVAAQRTNAMIFSAYKRSLPREIEKAWNSAFAEELISV